MAQGEQLSFLQYNQVNRSQEDLQKDLNAIRSMVNNHNYAIANSIQSLGTSINKPKRVNRDAIRRAVGNPYQNIETLQNASALIKATNGIYARIINYHSTMLTYDYMLYPTNADKIKSPDKMQKSFMDTATYLDKLNIKYISKWIGERILTNGELYVYRIEDSTGIILQEIPSEICKITSIENNVQKYAINLGAITETTVLSFPMEIQKLYKKFKAGSINEKQLIDRSWYELKTNAVAFCLDRFSSKGFPYFSFLFDDLMELEDMKDLRSQTAQIENLKLIHQKLPIDKETGLVMMDLEVATAYHEATKRNVPVGTAVTTSPLDVTAISLSKASSQSRSEVEDARNNIYDSAGINAELFNGNKSSNEAIASGLIVDSMVSMKIQELIENYINYELTLLRKTPAWKIAFLGSTEFNKIERAKHTRENMAFGGSRMEWLASNGYTPLQAVNVLKMEQMLGLDELIIPQQTSHTVSGSDSESGRPTKEETGTNGKATKPETE